jgi:hypothetical protein
MLQVVNNVTVTEEPLHTYQGGAIRQESTTTSGKPVFDFIPAKKEKKRSTH